MTVFLFHTIVYALSFLGIWFGAGMILTAIQKIARNLRLPAFTVSFFLLGILTSLPEMAIGSTAVLSGTPSIFVGNLLGGVVVLFLGVIPLLGIFGGGVSVPKQLDQKRLVATLVVALAPAFLILDKQLSRWEALFLIVLYIMLLLFFSFKQSIPETIKSKMKKKKKFKGSDFLKVIVGMGLLVLCSNRIVDSTIYFAQLWHISAFFVSLVIVSVGTNLPELALAFRSILKGKKEIALADYLGSASANTFLFGVFTLLHGKPISLPTPFMQQFVFLVIGLVLFFFFARSKDRLSWKECVVLFGGYLFFVWLELNNIAK